MEYCNKRQVNLPYEAALKKVTDELKKEGFGIPSQIDVKTLLKEKLGVDFGKYIILGACNPPFAHQALQAEADIGLMMPCNVIVYERGGRTTIAAIKPTISMQVVGNQSLAGIAEEVEKKLKKVIDAI